MTDVRVGWTSARPLPKGEAAEADVPKMADVAWRCEEAQVCRMTRPPLPVGMQHWIEIKDVSPPDSTHSKFVNRDFA